MTGYFKVLAGSIVESLQSLEHNSSLQVLLKPISADDLSKYLDINTPTLQEVPKEFSEDEQTLRETIKGYKEHLYTRVFKDDEHRNLLDEIIKNITRCEMDSVKLNLEAREYYQNDKLDLITGTEPGTYFQDEVLNVIKQERKIAQLFREITKGMDPDSTEVDYIWGIINLNRILVRLSYGMTMEEAFTAMNKVCEAPPVDNLYPELKPLLHSDQMGKILGMRAEVDEYYAQGSLAILNAALYKIGASACYSLEGESFMSSEHQEGYVFIHKDEAIFLIATEHAPPLDLEKLKTEVENIGADLSSLKWRHKRAIHGGSYIHSLMEANEGEPEDFIRDYSVSEPTTKACSNLALMRMMYAYEQFGLVPFNQVALLGIRMVKILLQMKISMNLMNKRIVQIISEP